MPALNRNIAAISSIGGLKGVIGNVIIDPAMEALGL